LKPALRLCAHICRFKAKITTFYGRDFCLGETNFLAGGFTHSLDALGAKYFMHLASLFHHQGLLQIRFEFAVGGSLGEGTRVPEGCGFSTMCAFSHLKTSFLAIIPVTITYPKARDFIT
jgi:hypothetical protein